MAEQMFSVYGISSEKLVKILITNSLTKILKKYNEFVFIFLFFGVKNLYFNKYFVVLLYLIPKRSIRYCPFVVITGKSEEKARTRDSLLLLVMCLHPTADYMLGTSFARSDAYGWQQLFEFDG